MYLANIVFVDTKETHTNQTKNTPNLIRQHMTYPDILLIIGVWIFTTRKKSRKKEIFHNHKYD